jgi:hypothetical protein
MFCSRIMDLTRFGGPKREARVACGIRVVCGAGVPVDQAILRVAVVAGEPVAVVAAEPVAVVGAEPVAVVGAEPVAVVGAEQG